MNHLLPQDRQEAIANLIKNFLEPAGDRFVEELVFRFLLTRGDTLGGSMRNAGGSLALRKFIRAMLSSLTVAGVDYHWQHSKTRKWLSQSDDDAEIEFGLRGISWQTDKGSRTLIFNMTVPITGNNVDICLMSLRSEDIETDRVADPQSYIALGELKGGIDPAGADEHWKTARAALDRIRDSFSGTNLSPHTFFIGAAIEKRMAGELWEHLQIGVLSNAANLNDDNQVAAIARWLWNL